MSAPVSSLPGPTAETPSGPARSYIGRSWRTGGADLPGGDFDAFRNWSPDARRSMQLLVLRDLRTRTVRLAEGLRLFEIPNRESLAGYRAALSSAPDRFTASAVDGASTGIHLVEVQSTTRGQTNVSDYLVAAADPSLDPAAYEPEEVWDPYAIDPPTEDWTAYETDDDLGGAEVTNYRLNLTVDGETRAVDVQVVWNGPLADDNESVLAKIGRQAATTDGRLDYEVVSRTEEDENGNPVRTAALVLKAAEAGTGLSFSIEDGVGDLAASLGLSNSVDGGSPARIVFDSEELESETGEVEVLGGAASIRVHGRTEGVEELEVAEGLPALVRQTGEVLRQYNEYVNFLFQRRSMIEPTLVNGLLDRLDEKRGDMRSIGLEPLGYGAVLMTDKFAALLQAEPEKVRETLTGPQGFFTEARMFLEETAGRNLWDYAVRFGQAPRTIWDEDKLIGLRRSALNLSIMT